MDYSKCIINPNSSRSLADAKSRYDEFTKVNDKFITYIVLMYDINSPIRGMTISLSERKLMAAQEVGYEMKDGRFSERTERLLLGMDNAANKAVCRYIIMHGSPDLVAYTAYSEILDTELTRSLAKEKYSPQEVKVIRDNIDRVTKDLNGLYQKIFGGDESKSMKDKLYETIIEDRLLFVRPENVARALADGEYVPPDIYGVIPKRNES